VALIDSSRAIGAVTSLLRSRLNSALQGLQVPQIAIMDVSVGRPEPAQGQANGPRLNLFLYEIEFDAQLKNLTLDDGQPPPLWLVLRYLLTPFDSGGESDTVEAHSLLGEAARALHELNFLSLSGLPATQSLPLRDAPDRLKLTFENASTDLLSRIMQGSEERYRTSMAFQVRPVMIAPAAPPAYSLLVGVDYVHNTKPGLDDIGVALLASMGPRITSVTPANFEVNDEVVVEGDDLMLDGLTVELGGVEIPVIAQHTDRLTFRVSPTLAGGTLTSAGMLPLAVVQALSRGRKRRSDLLVGGLLPRLDTAMPSGLARVGAGVSAPVKGRITLHGVLLGTPTDDVYAGLYRNASVVRLVDTFARPANDATQTQVWFDLVDETAVPPGDYQLILRVNGRQAKNSPSVHMVAP
jgi:hypothetical protein